MRALVVDDSRAMRALLTNILRGIGAEVVQATDGRDALEQLRRTDALPDLVLIDWHMPEMNGLELVKAVRKDPAWKPMTLMMVTTESEHENMVRALLAGADEYLIKPFTPDALLEKLNLLGVPVPEQALAAVTGG
ncbi:MAG: response regulator [Actinomycetota bacterium]|nr:response regulator [Actinomycetota bacterium]